MFHKETPSVGESTPLFQASKDTGMALGPGSCHAQGMSCSGRETNKACYTVPPAFHSTEIMGMAPSLWEMVDPQKYSTASSLCYPSSMMTGDIVPFQDTNPCTLKPATLAGSSVHLCKTEKNQLADLLIEYKDVFAKSPSGLGRCDRIQHAINTGTAVPVRQPTRRLPFGKREAVQEEIAKMLDRGIIEPSNSPWSSPVVLVTKKDGSIRFYVDYRVLNSVTVKGAYSFPREDECLDALSRSKWYSSMDRQVGLRSEDRGKTAFATSLGLLHFTVIPFGLANAPSTFDSLVEKSLTDCAMQTFFFFFFFFTMDFFL